MASPKMHRYTTTVWTGAEAGPRVTITADSDPDRAKAVHERAYDECFIANSMNFPVRMEAVISVEA